MPLKKVVRAKRSLRSINNLGTLLSTTERLEEAEALYREALQGLQQDLG